MELLLNLLWVAIVVAAFSVFLRKRRDDSVLPKVPYGKALLALACVLVLLFPFVSASDDLHPTQAVLEDATKRMQQAVAPYQQVRASLFASMLPALLAVYLIFTLVMLHAWRPITCEAGVIDRERTPHDGRSPPSL
jgi:amino acid transporter